MRVLLARGSLAHDYSAGGAALFDIVNVQNWTRRRISGPLKHARFRTGSGAALLLSIFQAGLAHRAEHSPCKREAGGSSPPASTTRTKGRNRPVAGHRFGKAVTGGETADAAASEAAALAAWRFKSSRVYQHIARFAKRPRHRSHTPTFPGSSSGASTNRFVSLAAIAPARHAGDLRFESATKHQSTLP